ncbi:pathogenesis-related thaumatin-like protein 3.5 [Henckelia pumila]|uniref:pathogenesis-related thaumatin-like protein 3.5 n=1 Tax=Henckelia pumila TaxID=405737 RepID=UPI003C6E4967
MASNLCAIAAVMSILFAVLSGIRLSECTRFTIINNCKDTIWPGITPNNFSGGGFALKPKETKIFTSSPTWNGRIWARTGCDFDTNGNGTCQTGGCGRALQCSGPGQPPASIAQFSLGEIDYYDVSLVDGFNLPIVVKPVGGKGSCSAAGCDSDLRPNCSSELALVVDGKIIACQSACSVFNTDEYCCRGAYSAPMACLPTNYSRPFKTACPAAYSFAHDDATSVMTCSSTDYVVTFCSSRNQTECTYHDGKLSCNGSSGRLTQVTQTLKLLVMALAMGISVQVML